MPRYCRVMGRHRRGYLPTGVAQREDMVEEAAEEITLEEVQSSIARLKSKRHPVFVG